MTVVEAYVGGEKMDSANSSSQLPTTMVSLLTESIAQNTNGSVFTPVVCLTVLRYQRQGI